MTDKKRRYIATEIWNKRWFNELSMEARFLYLYLLTNPIANLCGVYELMDEQVTLHTGITNLQKAFEELGMAGEVLRHGDWVVIIRYLDNHKWQTSYSIGLRVVKELEDLPGDILRIVRESDIHYPPIKSEQAFKTELGRLREVQLYHKQKRQSINKEDTDNEE